MSEKHVLREVGQQVRCRRCKRIWDYDERPDEDEPCTDPNKD